VIWGKGGGCKEERDGPWKAKRKIHEPVPVTKKCILKGKTALGWALQKLKKVPRKASTPLGFTEKKWSQRKPGMEPSKESGTRGKWLEEMKNLGASRGAELGFGEGREKTPRKGKKE